MNNEKDALALMLEQYEANNKPKYDKKSEKVYDLKNYFNTMIKDGVKSATKTIRILPVSNGTPFVQLYTHKIQVDGEWKTFPCLKHEKNEACPFCEAREALLSTGLETDKELAKKYGAKLMYVVKLIDRDASDDGVKFWRFNHDYRKEGIYDKIFGVLNALKKDVTNAQTGRDLVITINRNQNNFPVVSSIVALDPTPLSENEEQANKWLSDERTWEDVYAVKTYDYLEIIVKGGIPVWDKEKKVFVDKSTLNSNEEIKNLESELKMGVENVKSNIKEATSTITETKDSEDDDLPF